MVAYNFVVAERDQRFLLPPDVREWLPENHLAWFVIDVVDHLDLDRFRSALSRRCRPVGRASAGCSVILATVQLSRMLY